MIDHKLFSNLMLIAKNNGDRMYPSRRPRILWILNKKIIYTPKYNILISSRVTMSIPTNFIPRLSSGEVGCDRYLDIIVWIILERKTVVKYRSQSRPSEDVMFFEKSWS